MPLSTRVGIAIFLASGIGFSQTSAYQVAYATNLDIGDSVIHITNTGASGESICVNVYAFSPDEQMISCCSCLVSPNALAVVSVVSDLINSALTPTRPTSIVVDLLASKPNSGSCNAASVQANNLTHSAVAWYTKQNERDHRDKVSGGFSELPALPAQLSTSELARLTSLCGFIQTNGSGYGICNGAACKGTHLPE